MKIQGCHMVVWRLLKFYEVATITGWQKVDQAVAPSFRTEEDIMTNRPNNGLSFL